MKAVVIRQFGGPEVLRLEEVPAPVVGPNDILIRVAAVTVNRTLDLAVRAGKYARPVTLPHVLGVDPSGTIVEVGTGVTLRKAGQRVTTSPHVVAATKTSPPIMLGVHVWGGYAEYVVVPAQKSHLIPDGLDFIQATIVGRHGPLAYNLLSEKARVQPGDYVLIMGAGGGLGSMGVQVAKELGSIVIAAAGSTESVELAKRLGADFAISYRDDDIALRVREITGGKGVNVVFENVGDPELFPKAFKSLARNGRLVTAGAHAGPIVPFDLSHLYLNAITVIGSTAQTDADMKRSLEAAASGALRAEVARVLPLQEAALAHELVAGRITGKVVLTP